MSNSTHVVEVVPLNLEKHPNADKLSIVRIGGYTVCTQTEQWNGKDRAAYIPPDSLVDVSRPEFSFLKKNKPFERISAKKLRGVISFGLLVPAPEGSNVGDDVTELLGVKHWNEDIPEETSTRADKDRSPFGWFPKYDIDSLRSPKYKRLFNIGEPVFVTEKLNGSFARYYWCPKEDRLFVGSRTNWYKEDDKNIWWKALRNQPEILKFCQENPGLVLNGEVYGHVGGFWYGPQKNIRFAAFDVRRGDIWFDSANFVEICEKYNISMVPIYHFSVPFNFDELDLLTNGPSLVKGAANIREGIVVKPVIERNTDSIGRLILKLVGSEYLLKG